MASGSIPAPAGETGRRSCSCSTTTVHPRACGGNIFFCSFSLASFGPSPRLRGKLALQLRSVLQPRSIPAPAGETRSEGPGWRGKRVHPRACGGNCFLSLQESCNKGPSPRLRGKRDRPNETVNVLRSIPAPAGETAITLTASSTVMVHPRACGGNEYKLYRVELEEGPSPRLRGKHLPGLAAVDTHGSIPAPAGETR